MPPESRDRAAKPALRRVRVLVAAVALACAQAPEPVPLPPPPPRALEPAAAPPAAAQAIPRAESAPAQVDDTLVVIDHGAPQPDAAATLAEAAAAERERRRQAEAAAVVLTDANLAERATGALTFAEPAAAGGVEGVDAMGAEDTKPADPRGEAYWRERMRAARSAWRQAVDRIAQLEGEATKLRRHFYAEDDPWVRDGQIKPAWDRALVDLAAAQESAEVARMQVEALMEEGRRAGALPGWLREGLELAPAPANPPRPPAEPMEPPVVEEGDGEP